MCNNGAGSSRAHIKGSVCQLLLGLRFNLKCVTTLLRQRLDSVSWRWQCDGRSGRTLTEKDPAVVIYSGRYEIQPCPGLCFLPSSGGRAVEVTVKQLLRLLNNFFNPDVQPVSPFRWKQVRNTVSDSTSGVPPIKSNALFPNLKILH